MAIQGAMQVQIPASAVGANGYTFTINWPLAGVDLTTADTLSGNIRLTETGDPFPISGVLTATGANELTWKLHSSDTLTQGTAEVQFRATFGTDNIISAPSKWLIYNTLSGTLPPPDPSAVSFIRNNGDGTYSFLSAADFRTAIGAGTGDGDMPLIDPATANNLAIQAADGSLVDAGYGVSVADTDNTVALRNSTGGLAAKRFVALSSSSQSIVAAINLGTGPAMNSTAINNANHHEFGSVSAISRTTGALTFLGAGAAANRAAQRTELGLGTAATQDTTAFDADGSAAGVQDNLNTHTGLTTAAHGGIVAESDSRLTDARTPTAHAASHTSGGSDPLTPADIGAEVAGTTATHAALTGTAVHGLGTASTQAETAFARLAGRAGGQTLIGGTAANNAIVLQGTSSAGNTATAIGAQIKVGDAGTTNAVTVLNNGNVGIGTNLPGNTLHIERTLATNTVGIFMNIISSGGEGNGFLVRAGGANSGRFSMRLQNAAGDTHFNMLSNGTCAIGGGVTFRTGMRSFIGADAAAVIGQVIQLAATPTANAQEIRNSAGTVLSATRPDGSWQPPQIADGAAANNSLYYSTTSSKLVYKDFGGTVNALY